MKKFSVVTTFNEEGFQVSGKKMIESFDKFWKGVPMYLYILDSKGFKHIPGLKSFEVVSYEQPKIKKIIHITDTYKAMEDSGEVELIPYRVYKHMKLY